jgi:hypothetical protein
MAISRSVWIDDDGTGTTGTIINNAELQKIYNNIDAMGAPPYQVIASTDTGTIPQWTPSGFGTRNAVILWTGAADATIQLLKSGIEGQIVTVRNAGSAVLRFAQNATPASGFAPFSNSVTTASTPVAVGGYLQYFFTAGYWVIVGHEQGAWVNEPFNAANFGQMTVTAGQVTTNRYRLSGRSLTWSLEISNATVPSSVASVTVRLPGGWTGWSNSRTAIHLLSGGAWGVGFAGATAGVMLLGINRPDFSNIAAGGIYLVCTIPCEVS